MPTKRKFILPLLATTLFAAAPFSHAQSWTLTSATNAAWKQVVSSADGTKLAGMEEADLFYGTQGGIVYSTDSGSTWTALSDSPATGWSAIACATSGARFIGGNVNKLYTMSTFPTSNWHLADTMIGSPADINSVASSSAGFTLLVGTGYTLSTPPYLGHGELLVSTDGGNVWATNNVSASVWYAVAVSGDGGTLAAAQSGGAIYFSTDAGNTWVTNNSPTQKWQALALSSDGGTLAAVVTNGLIYVTTNSGVTWQTNDAPSAFWRSIAMSADATRMVAACTTGIYTSTNSGVNWTKTSAPNLAWNSVASSADGSKLVAASALGGSGSIYTWQLIPTLNLAAGNGAWLFSWPYLSSTTNYVLQQNSNLAGTNWTAVTNVPGITNGQFQMVVPSQSGNQFYRLQKSQ